MTKQKKEQKIEAQAAKEKQKAEEKGRKAELERLKRVEAAQVKADKVRDFVKMIYFQN